MKKIVALVGESASGKSSIERQLEVLGFQRVISHTSRPMRSYETHGSDYYYVSPEEFEKLVQDGEMAEYQMYNNWHYGATIEEVESSDVIVIAPDGFRQLVETLGRENVYGIYVKVSERQRLIRLAQRGDDIDEAIRRIQADRADFYGFEFEADAVVENERLDLAVNEVYNLIKSLNK